MNIETALNSIKILSVEPCAYHDSNAGGYFNLKITTNGVIRPHTLKYTTFLQWLLNEDVKLRSYLASKFKGKQETETLSHVVEELYDIGFDVELSVKNYFEYVKSNVDRVLLAKVLTYLGFDDFDKEAQN
jgi:hypothetical protein